MLNDLLENLFEQITDIEQYADTIETELKHINSIQDMLVEEIAKSRYNCIEIYYKMRELQEIRQIRRTLKQEREKIREVQSSFGFLSLKNKIKGMTKEVKRVTKKQGKYHDNWIIDKEQPLRDLYVEKTKFL